MTWRTVLLLIGLLCCGSTQALAQTVDTSPGDALTEQTSPVTQQVTTAVEELESATSDVLDSGGSSGGSSSSDGGASGGSSSSGDSDPAEPCEPNAAGGSQGGGGGSSDSEGQFAASGRDRALAADREPADKTGGGVLGGAAGEDGTTGRGDESEAPPTPLAPPEAPSELPFWGGLALLVVLGLGFAGFVAALTSHFLGRTRAR